MRFLELRRQCGVSHEVRRGAQGASRVASGKSGLHARGEGGASWLSSHGRGLGPRDALKKDSRVPGTSPGLSRVFEGETARRPIQMLIRDNKEE